MTATVDHELEMIRQLGRTRKILCKNRAARIWKRRAPKRSRQIISVCTGDAYATTQAPAASVRKPNLEESQQSCDF